MITVVEKARSKNLTSLARLKSRLGITGTDRDEDIRDLIAEASDAIVAFCNRVFAREDVTESLQGYGRTTLMLSRTPLVHVAEVRYKGVVISPSGYSVQGVESGFLFNENNWEDDRPTDQWITSQFVNERGPENYHVDYVGGYLMPDDDITASGIATALAVDNSFNLPGTGSNYWPMVASGESVIVAGWSDDANNGTFNVISRTRTKLVVDGPLVNASGVQVVSFGLRNVPRDLERLCIMAVQYELSASRRDPGLKSESIGDWSGSYVAGQEDKGNRGLPTRVCEGLINWTRIE